MKGYGQQLEATKFYHEAKFGAQIKNSSMSCLISKTPLYRSCNIFFVSTTLRMTIKHLTIRILLPDHVGFMKEITPLNYKRYINQNTTFITLMMMMCTSGYTNAIDILTFDIEEIDETGKLMLASFYLDGIAIYWHQNFIKSKGCK